MTAAEVVHPSWCAPSECLTATTSWGLLEVSHQGVVCAFPLARPREVVAPEPPPASVDLAASWRRPVRAVVCVMSFDDTEPDGSRVSGAAVVVLDVAETVVTMTPIEAARVGAALLRAARQAVGGAR